MWLLYRYEPPWFCLSFLFIPLHLCAATNRLLSFCCDDTSSAFWLNLINILLGALIKYSHWCQNSCLPSSTGLCSFFLTEKRAHGVQLGYCALLLRACTVAETTVGIWCFSRKSLEWFHLEEVTANGAAWGGQAASGQHLQWLQIIFQVSFYRGRYCVAGLQNNLYSLSWFQIVLLLSVVSVWRCCLIASCVFWIVLFACVLMQDVNQKPHGNASQYIAHIAQSACIIYV